MLNCGVLPSTCGDAAAKVQGQALDGVEANGEHPEICVVGVVRVGQQRIRRIIGGAGGGVVYEGKAHDRTKKPTTA